MLVHDEGVTVIAIKAVSGGKPHEAPAILQNGSNIALRQAIVRGEMGEFEVPHQSIAALGMDILKVASGRVSSPPAVPGLRRQVGEAFGRAGFICSGT